ncbi:protein MOR1 isoform X2 [Musa acuminata AAA Group]|uniref:Protein MOR1 n=1 Tax=Musa acuminata subsp. malaccensis TaxID=214687 RepID=A0A804HYA8_MUSAM|nr:PREDICTED: protein MOR1-like isoform X2 [Musa acuminata subsp. malaccensis]
MSTEDEKLLKEAKKLPWEERLLHKNWKVRNDANIDLAALCDSITDPKDPRLKEFGPLFRKTVADSNAPVQEKALDALIAFLRAADADAGRYAKEVCDSIVAKCLTGRPKTVEKAQTAFLLWVELEATEVFLEAMEKAIKNKVAKAVVPAIDVMFQALSEFGAKVVPPKKILKMLPELFDHQDQNVRASSKGLTLELCRWIGKEPVKSILFEKMRDTMKKELEAELVNVSGIARPTRKIRSEQDKEPEQEVVSETLGAGASEESTVDAPQEIDEYELVDPVDILTPLDKSGFWDGVKAVKWSERRDAVAELTKLSSTKRIAPGDFSELCRTLKKLVTDVNLAVSVEAIQAVGNLAKGLRNHFAASSRFLLPLLLEKLKEKKPVMTEALTQALQGMHKSGCLTLADAIEDVKLAIKNKVPHVRSLTLNWVTFCIETNNKATVLKLHKDYVPIFLESLNDGTPEVRDAAFAALAAVAKMVGMRPLERSLEKLDDVRKKKLSDLIGSSGGGENSTSGEVTILNSTTRISSNGGANSSFVRRSAVSMLSGRKPIQTATKKSVSVKTNVKKADGAGQSKALGSVETEDVEPGEMSLEEIEGRLGSLIKAETISQLKSGVWKERLEAVGLLKQEVENLQNLDQSAEILIRFLCAVPGWSEKNVQVQQQVIEVITYIVSTVKRLPKRCVVLCLLGISERVADIKTRSQAMKCLTTFSEAVGPGFIFDRLYKIMKDHKNPKVLSEGISWMVSAVEDFGVSHIKLKDLIDFCKDIGLQSSTAATRNATIKLIGTLHKFVGPDIKGFMTDVKPALLSALDAEYEKNPYEGAAAAPKKAVKALDSGSSISAAGSDGLPREDISAKITPNLLKDLGSPDWKVRLESIESINKILEEAHKRIQPSGTVELFGALRGRLCDSNKNLVMATLTVIGSLASAMGSPVEKSSKGILSDILKCLGDNKKHMRECTLNTLDSWVLAVHLDKMVPYITVALADSKLGAEGRKDLFDWLTRHLSKANDLSDASHLLKPTAAALTDKSAEVRKAAECCIGEVLRVCGQEAATKCMKDLKGPALALVLERIKPSSLTEEASESTRLISMGLASKPIIKNGKPGSNISNDRGSRPGTKTTSMRGVPTRASKLDPFVSAQDLAVQSQALFNIKDSNKEDRERLVIRRFKFEEPRPEQIQDLEYDFVKHFREDLHRRLLSTDFKKQVDGLELLQKVLATNKKEIIELLDILLRWFVLRFCESNTTCLLKVLEFLPELFGVLKDEGYTLTEAEAAMFLPCLAEKSGHNIEKVREKMREMMKQIVIIYSASKFLPYILEGLRSKNNRTRIECVDFIEYLIDHYGAEIGQLKCLQLVAGLTSERDGEIRKAALNTMATAYKNLGEDVWRYVGKLSDAQRSMLDDRFKWKAREMEKRKEGKPGDARAALRRSVRENGLDVAEQSGEVYSRSVSVPMAARENISYAHSDERNILARQFAGANGPTDWHEALDIIAMGLPEQSVEGMKVICHELTQVSNDPDSCVIEDLVKDADRLVSCLATMVPNTFNFSLSGASSRSCKYVLNTLMQTFQIKKLAHAVKESTLDNLITELLLWLLDERVPLMDDGSQLLKALNVLMLKILDNAERTSSFVVLINLLRPLDSLRWPSPVSSEALVTRNQKFSDLVVKCLIKLTKVLQSTIYEVDLDRILQSIHVYLQELGMEEIRRRAGADDKPLRMVKTVLHELVKLRGTAIKGHLSMVPIDTEPQPIILAYIDLNLQTLAAARMLTPSGPMGQTHWGDTASNSPTPTTHSADAQLKQELAAVFKKIGDKQTCTIGLYELYRITQLYPKVDIFAQLQNASEAFRTYIRDGLAQMEKNAVAGRTPSSLPMSTPPPIATLPSPKFGPLSPVHTKLINAKNESIHPNVAASYVDNDAVGSTASLRGQTDASEFRPHLGDDRMDRYPAAPAVTMGTLDAIRERMKSIQAAAAAGSLDGSGRPLAHINGNVLHGERVDGETPTQTNILPMDEKALSGLQARMERLKSGSLEPL